MTESSSTARRSRGGGRGRRGFWWAVVVVAAITQLPGCRAGTEARASPASTPDAAFTADTVRGIVTITGSEPLTTVQLTTADGIGWRLVGDSLSALRAAVGLEVMVRGAVRAPEPETLPSESRPGESRPGAHFNAVRFLVRRADGISAQDGVLERVGTGFALRLADDRRVALATVPTPLRDLVGARIWWAGPLDRPPLAYGVLTERR